VTAAIDAGLNVSDARSAISGSAASMALLVQAIAPFGAGAADNNASCAIPSGADMAQNAFLTVPLQ
jgi:hypothetical protein